MSFFLFIIYVTLFIQASNANKTTNFLHGAGWAPHAFAANGRGIGSLIFAIISVVYLGATFTGGLHGGSSIVNGIFTFLFTIFILSGIFLLGNKESSDNLKETNIFAKYFIYGNDKSLLELAKNHLIEDTSLGNLKIIDSKYLEMIDKENFEIFPYTENAGKYLTEAYSIFVDNVDSKTKKILSFQDEVKNLEFEKVGLVEELSKAKEAMATSQEAIATMRSKLGRDRVAVDYSRMSKAQREEEQKALMDKIRKLREIDSMESNNTQTKLPLS